MLLLIFYTILITAAGVAVFLLLANNEAILKHNPKSKLVKKISRPIVVTLSGKVIENEDELNIELEILNRKLEEKQSAIEKSKDKLSMTEKNMFKLQKTKSEILKHYAGLQYELEKTMREFDEIKTKICEYSQKSMSNQTSSTTIDTCQQTLNIITKRVSSEY